MDKKPAALEGWKLVPLEPTNAMTYVGQKHRYEPVWSIGAIYREMLAASPAESAQSGEPVVWMLWIGDSDMWSYMKEESDADFYGSQSGLRYEKRPLYAAPQPSQPVEAGEWLPTSENINALPEPIRTYIAALETNCDPAGMVRENAILRHDNAEFETRLAEQSAVVLDDEHAAPQPSQPVEAGEACAHDYVRSDRVCTECGEKSAADSQDERAAQDSVTREQITEWAKRSGFAPSQWSEKLFESFGDFAIFARAASPQATATQPAQTERALTMSADELDEFALVAEDFEDNGETSTDYETLMDWAQRGFLECTHFEVTKAGTALLAAAQPASGGDQQSTASESRATTSDYPGENEK